MALLRLEIFFFSFLFLLTVSFRLQCLFQIRVLILNISENSSRNCSKAVYKVKFCFVVILQMEFRVMSSLQSGQYTCFDVFEFSRGSGKHRILAAAVVMLSNFLLVFPKNPRGTTCLPSPCHPTVQFRSQEVLMLLGLYL